MWAALIITLPTRPNAVRLRIWRGLKTLGCAALRDGAYLLPETQADLFEPWAAEVRAHGGSASVLTVSPREPAQRLEIEALFDRGEAYAQWREAALALQAGWPLVSEAEARRRLRGSAESLAALQRIDYYPDSTTSQADAELARLRQALDAIFSPGEPQAAPPQGMRRLVVARFQNKCWVSRARPWVDRLACAWLIRRFIDVQARILWLADPASAPRGALGFDFDGARFSHVGALVSVEVLAASFDLEGDHRLQRVMRLVHALDVGGMPVAEAAGLEAVLAGLREVHADDDALMLAAAGVFDALYAAPVHPTASSP